MTTITSRPETGLPTFTEEQEDYIHAYIGDIRFEYEDKIQDLEAEVSLLRKLNEQILRKSMGLPTFTSEMEPA